ncbi:MAG TPA: hypothetical protein VFH79_00035 [Candidatus Limnocylindria bacterium]|nr:hypothetical protein [Candidatus Limnocylindria bacterium]
MTIGPWLVWVPLLALINLLVFLAVRGRFGRSALGLLVASVVGVAVGDAIAEPLGIELLRIGDMNVLLASVGAQLLMIVVSLLSALGPVRVED